MADEVQEEIVRLPRGGLLDKDGPYWNWRQGIPWLEPRIAGDVHGIAVREIIRESKAVGGDHSQLVKNTIYRLAADGFLREDEAGILAKMVDIIHTDPLNQIGERIFAAHDQISSSDNAGPAALVIAGVAASSFSGPVGKTVKLSREVGAADVGGAVAGAYVGGKIGRSGGSDLGALVGAGIGGLVGGVVGSAAALKA